MLRLLLFTAFTLVMPGDTLERAALRPIAELGATEEVMAWFFGTVGTLRAFALYMNGHINNGRVFPSGANIRAFGALGGALVWGQLALALFVDAFHAHSPSLNIAVFGTLCMFELLSCFIARKDAIRRQDTLAGQIEALRRELDNGGVVLVPAVKPPAKDVVAGIRARRAAAGRAREGERTDG